MDESTVLASQPGSFVSDLAGVFDFLIDPQAAARRLPRKYFWLAPLAIISIVTVIVGVMNFPLVQQALSNQPPPPNMSPEQFQQRLRIGFVIQQVLVYLSPLVIVAATAVCAGVVLFCSTAIGMKARFLELFNFVAGLSIFDALRAIATTIIIHFKGEPSSMADLQPALGLDIFAPAGMNRIAVGFLGYFNVFEVWEIVMAILIFAAAYRVSKGKALIAVGPIFLLGLLLRLIGAVFSPK